MHIEKRYSNGIVLRGVGETREEAKKALKEEKKRYEHAMRSGLMHLYFKKSLDEYGNHKKVRSPGLHPYKKQNGRVGLRLEPNHMADVWTPKQSVFENVYGKKENDS
jgi:hypothetical protein